MKTQRVEEFFYNGLTKRTQLEMVRLNVKNTSEMLCIIQTTENTMIEQMRNSKSTNNKQNNEQFENRKFKHENENKPKKFCEFHKSTGHSTEECRSRKTFNSKKFNNNEREGKSLALCEPKAKPKALETTCTINGHTLNTMIDTGSAFNYNKEEVTTKTGIQPIPTEVHQTCMANGENVQSDKKILTNILFQGDTNVEYKCELRLLKNLATEVILGIEFLERNNTIIDLKEGVITIYGKQYELEGITPTSNAYERTLTEKTKIFSCKTESTQEKINNIIKEFKESSKGLGNIQGVEHKINTRVETAIRCKPYRVPLNIMKETRNELNKLIENGIIRKSNSEYCSPAFPILKKNGNVRIVVDYRRLNSVTEPLNFPLPHLHDILQDLKGSTVYSQIDLNMGYYQINMNPTDIKKTSFVLCNQQYEFLRMPFGLSNAPRTFQRSMNEIFSDLDFVKIYLDDILIHSNSDEEHLEHLSETLKRIKQNNITINAKKSNFYQKTVTYLGATISKEGIIPDTSRIKANLMTTPDSKKKLQRILGLINWFRPFIKNLSTRISCLYDKLKTNNHQFTWTNHDQSKLDLILNEIKEKTLLNFPDFTKTFYIETDASNVGLGGVLYQEEKLIGYYSYKFTRSEMNYSVVEKET
jgi:hypothetical protein